MSLRNKLSPWKAKHPELQNTEHCQIIKLPKSLIRKNRREQRKIEKKLCPYAMFNKGLCRDAITYQVKYHDCQDCQKIKKEVQSE